MPYPARRLSAAVPEPIVLLMTDNEIRAVGQAITHPGQRLIVALAGVHAARWEAIQALTLDDLDLPNRRITVAGHPSGSATSVTRRCGPGLTTAARPGRTPPTGTS